MPNLPCQVWLIMQAIAIITIAVAVGIQGRIIRKMMEDK